MSLFTELQERKIVYQHTGKSLEELCEQVKVAYIGMDATAISVHAGYLIPIMLANILMKHGVKMIILLGGGTTKVGDPTGKNAARKILSQEEILKNEAGLRKVIEKFFPGATIVNNADWLGKLGMMDYLTDVARYVSVSGLIHGELFANRLKNHEPLSMMELTYPILQGYDFLHLHREYGCNLQLGGSDQWNNILVGVDLVSKIEKENVHGLTCPLLLTSDGRKMGKTEKGTIWLDAELCSVFDFWQYWRNIDDADCMKYIELLIAPDQERLADLKQEDINKQKKFLATELTAYVHGRAVALEAQEKAESIFEHGLLDNIREMELAKGLSLKEVVANIWNLSNSEAKTLIQQGGITVDEKNLEINHKFSLNEIVVICKGKKEYVRVKFVV